MQNKATVHVLQNKATAQVQVLQRYAQMQHIVEEELALRIVQSAIAYVQAQRALNASAIHELAFCVYVTTSVCCDELADELLAALAA